MEEAAAVRRAASEATADVVPEELRETIDGHVADGSLVPGVLTLLSARAVSGEDPDDLAQQAAGVQLIYDGLRLTRRIAHSNPWREHDPTVVADGDRAADLDRRLETDVLELAVTTGVTAAGGHADDAAGLATEFTPDRPRFDPVDAFFDDARYDRVAGLSPDGGRALNRND